MNSIEALENIAITFDEGGYEPTTLGAKSGHFKEVFGDDFNTIKQELECLEKLEKAIDILKDKYDIALHLEYTNTKLLGLKARYFLKNKKTNDKRNFIEINEKEYELLKEVLGNE